MAQHQDRRRLNSALYVPCSLVQLARFVVCVRALVDVLCVMIVVLIGRHTVDAVLVAIYVVIFCNWRCTPYILAGLCTPPDFLAFPSLASACFLSATPS